MGKGSVVLITGRMGSGKSHYVVSQMPTLRGIIYTNIPVTDELPREVVKVSTEQVDQWILEGEEIKGPGYVLLDEAHFLFPPRMEGDRRARVREWLSLTRKRGITVWLITQLPEQIAPGVRELADYERMSYTRANEREPVTGIAVEDINQMKASITGIYTPVTWIDEYSAVGRTRVKISTKIHYLIPSVYKWYNSYSVDTETVNALKGGNPASFELTDGERKKDGDLGVRAEEEFEVYNPVHLFFRVLLRNFFGMATGQLARGLYVLLAVMLSPWIFPQMMWIFQSAIVLDETGKSHQAELQQEGNKHENKSRSMGSPRPPTPPRAASPVAVARINRVGTMLVISGQLYDAASIYDTPSAGFRSEPVPVFGTYSASRN